MTAPDSPEPTPGRAAGRLAALALVIRTAWRAARNREPTPPPPPRESDIDPSERTVPSNRRAETLVVVLLLLAAACGFSFTAIYAAAGNNTQLLGLAMGLTLA